MKLFSNHIRKLAVFFAAFCLSSMVQAKDNRPGLYIIYDSSNSMWATLPDGSRRYEAARAAMQNIVARDIGNREIALRMYGHRRKNDCKDSQLQVPFSPIGMAAKPILQSMNEARPTGRTPIDYSLRQALADFGDRKGSIILISDGIESCDADPCALVRAWKQKNIDIKVHVVGLGLKNKQRAAMQCIADAAGTTYHDAYSTDQLIEGLDAAIQQTASDANEPGEPEPAIHALQNEFSLVVETQDGVHRKGLGILTSVTGAILPVETFSRFTPEPGQYRLSAGVRTIDNTPYKPVETEVVVAKRGRTVARILAPTPPQVSAEFSMQGEELRTTVVTVFSDGKSLGSFKGDETAFLQPGTYVFRSKLAGASKPLVVTENFKDGDNKTVSFNAALEVNVNIIATTSSTGERLQGKPVNNLLQDGEVAHKVNRNSGGLVVPGSYTLSIVDDFNHFETGLVVGEAKQQEIKIDVPAGAVTVEYLDAEGQPESPKRVFITNLDHKTKGLRQSGQPFAVLPGRYRLRGWPNKNGYKDTEIAIAVGDNRKITLQATR